MAVPSTQPMSHAQPTPVKPMKGVGWAWDIGWVLGTAIALAFYFAIPCLKKRNLEKYDKDDRLLPAAV